MNTTDAIASPSGSSKKKSKDDIYTEAVARFTKCIDAEADNRAEALDDIRFARLGEQWHDNDKKQREADGRPCLTVNRMTAFIRQVVNDSRQNKPSIKCHPVDDNADVKTAEILNGLIRNIEVISNADIAYDTAIDSAVSGGFGYFRVVTDYSHDDTFDLDVLIKRVANPFTVYADPNGEAGDGSDWTYAFVTEWLTEEEFEKKYPDVDVKGWEDGSTGDDKEWIEDDKIRVAEYWTREEVSKTIYRLSTGDIIDQETYDENKEILELAGITVEDERDAKTWKVMQYWLGGGEVLETNEWPGKYIPIVPVYGDEVNVEGRKYYRSLIRDAKDPQRMFNYWRTNATEMIALAPKTPFVGAVGAFDTDAQKWATANVATHAYLEYDPVEGAAPPQRQPFAGPAGGALQEALNASDDMKSVMGIHDASLGARSNETSGVAIRARQHEGDVSTFHFIDNMTRAIRHAGKILVDLIPKVYDKPRILRVLGEDMQPKNVQVNQPSQGPDGTEMLYDLQAGKYDVTVHAGPSFSTKREEFSANVMQLVQAFPQAAPLIMDMVAKAQDWPEADKIAKRFHTMLPSQILQEEQTENGGPLPIPPQVQQQIQQMQQALQQAQQQNQQLNGQVQQLQGQIQSKQAEIAKAQLDLQGKQIEAATSAQNNRTKMAEISARALEAQSQQVYTAPQGPFQ